MKLCIITDLHCKYQRDSEPSETLLFSNMPRKPFNQHPVAAMIKAIEEDSSIHSDYLLCLGDLGDKADEQGISTAWTFAEEIKQKLNAGCKIGLPGNHDINSRKINNKEPFSYIQNFHESFPTNDESLNNKFWHQGYAILINNESLFLMINTVKDHLDEKKAYTSQIELSTLEDIKTELESINFDHISFRICLLHHHPIKHSNIINVRDGDSIDHGDDLIKLLNRFAFNIVIHGHKHQPRIVELNGLPIFATGSFSSFANLQATGYNTMFHIVELVKSKSIGKITSWEYNKVEGWTKCLNKNFPPIIGFGSNIDLDKVAYQINEILLNEGKPIFYNDILLNIPELEYLIPEKLVRLKKILIDKYGIAESPDFPLIPQTITII